MGGEPRKREQRLVEIRRALDASDREERTEDQTDVEAMAQKWEQVVEKNATSKHR